MEDLVGTSWSWSKAGIWGCPSQRWWRNCWPLPVERLCCQWTMWWCTTLWSTWWSRCSCWRTSTVSQTGRFSSSSYWMQEKKLRKEPSMIRDFSLKYSTILSICEILEGEGTFRQLVIWVTEGQGSAISCKSLQIFYLVAHYYYRE